MKQLKEGWREIMFKALKHLIIKQSGSSIPLSLSLCLEDIVLEIPPKAEMGDIAFPMFPYSRIFKKAPKIIADLVIDYLCSQENNLQCKVKVESGEACEVGEIGEHGEAGDASEVSKAGEGCVEAAGPYVNVYFDKPFVYERVFKQIENYKENYGCTETLKNQRIMCEYSCPNTNKPLHLGHLRNNSIGMSVCRILKANGADVF